MLAHDGGSKSAIRRFTHIFIKQYCIRRHVALAAGVAAALWGGAPVEAVQPVPEREPGPRLQVEPPAQTEPAPVETPRWVLEESSESGGTLGEALEAARRGDAEATQRFVTGSNAPGALRLAFAAQVALGNRGEADRLFYRVSWLDDGRTAARLAAWRGIVDGDPFLVRRSLEPLSSLTPGEQAALVWADWHEGKSLEGSLPALSVGGTAGVFLDLARDYQDGRAPEVGALPPAWARVARNLNGERQSGARDVLLEAYDAALRESWDQCLAQANRLLALYPGSDFTGHAYLLRGLGRLAEGDLELARNDLNLAKNFLHAELPVQVGLFEVFLDVQEGAGDAARNGLQTLRSGARDPGVEPMVLFHMARLARYQGREEDYVDAVLTLEEAYGDSPWFTRARQDVDSEDWALPALEIPIPPAGSAEVRVLPPSEGPFGLMLWGDDVLPRAAREVELMQASAREPEPEPEPVAQARPVTGNGARVLAGGGSRDTRYLEWDWTKEDFDRLGFTLEGAVTQTREGSALPRSDRLHFGGAVHQERDYGRLDAAGRWDSRDEGDGDLNAKGMFLDLGLESSDPSEMSGFRTARVRTLWGKLDTPESGWDYFRVESKAGLVYPALLGDLETDLAVDLGVQSRDGDRSVPWLLQGGLFLPLRTFGRVGIIASGADSEFQVLPSGTLALRLPGHFKVSAGWEPRMEYPDPHETFVQRGDWNVPDWDLAPVVMPLVLTSAVTWESLDLALEARGTHFRADNYRSWSAGENGVWLETGLDAVRGYELVLEGRRTTREGGLAALSVAHARTERHGSRVAFTPTWTGRAEVGVPYKRWYYAGILNGVAGRRDHQGRSYGDYLGLNLEATYATPMGLTASLRLVNLTNSPVRRWPDKPIFSRGIFAGLGYQFGS